MSLHEEASDWIEAESYLLGTLGDAEVFDFECKVFPDKNLSEQLDLFRHHLSEKYIDRQLSDSQIKQFENYFLSFPHNAEIFDFQKSLTAEINRRRPELKAVKETVTAVIEDEKKTNLWNRLLELVSLKNFAIPAFAALLLLIVGGMIWFNGRKNSELAEDRRPAPTPPAQITPGPAPVQDTPQLIPAPPSNGQNVNSSQVKTNQNTNDRSPGEQNQNRPPATPVPPQKRESAQPNPSVIATVSFLGSFRDVGSEAQTTVIHRQTEKVNLKFQFPKEDSKTPVKNYRLIVETMSGEKILDTNLSREGRKPGDKLQENISPNLLQTGKYRFRLVGVLQDDRQETVESETFVVKRVN